MAPTDPDIVTLKERLKTTWTSGDYSVIARGLERSAQEFLDRTSITASERMLDVACGTGQLSIPAAKAGVQVTGIDIAENWIVQARTRAEAENLTVRFDVGDVENMPYVDESFDVVISLIGAMFAPRPELAISEMLRVCRPGGRIIMGNWTPEGFIGEFFKAIGKYAPPPNMPSPLLWGSEAVVQERFGDRVARLQLQRQMLHFYYPMLAADLVDHYVEHFGPTKQVFAGLDPEGQEAFRKDFIELWSEHSNPDDGTTQVDGEILEVIAVRK